MFEVNSPEKLQVRKKDWYQEVEHMQVPNGMGPGVWMGKRPLSACYIRMKFNTWHDRCPVSSAQNPHSHFLTFPHLIKLINVDHMHGF